VIWYNTIKGSHPIKHQDAVAELLGQPMSTEAEYEKKIAEYDSSGILDLWKAIETGDTPGWADGKALEYLVLRAFQLEDAEVRWPYRVDIDSEEIEQIDGVVYTEGLACLIECKDTNERANIEPIAKLRNQLLRRPGPTIGIVVSRTGFTEPAVTLARFIAPQTILLWNGNELVHAIQKQSMRRSLLAKYRFCVERGLPVYNIIAEDIP
jgi:hypothetical protein